MTPAEDRTEYIVTALREQGAMVEQDARAFLAEHDNDVLAAAAAQQWAFARERWTPSADAATEARRKASRTLGAAERLIALIDPNPETPRPRHVRVYPRGAGFTVAWQLGDETASTHKGTRAEADAYAAELRAVAAAGLTGKGACEGESTQPASDFFQSDRTYTREHHGDRIEFQVEHIATPPGADYLVAFGWRRDPGEGWTPFDSDDVDGWTEATQPATVEFTDGTVALTGWRLTELAPDYYGHTFVQIGGWLPEGWKSGAISLGTNCMIRADLPGADAPALDLNVQLDVKGYGGPQRFMKIQWRKDAGESRG